MDKPASPTQQTDLEKQTKHQQENFSFTAIFIAPVG